MRKNKEKRKKKFSNWKIARKVMQTNTPAIVLFISVYTLLYDYVLRPAGQLLWTTAIRFSPVSYIISDNILQLLISPLIIVAVLIIALGLSCWTFLNIAAIVICVQYGMEGRRIRVYTLLKESFHHVLRALHPRNWPILIFSILIIPATHTFMTTNFISELAIPEYIAAVIRDTPILRILLYAAILFATWLTVQYLFLFQYFILENCNFRDAAEKSRKLIKGHRIKDALLLWWWNLKFILIYSFYVTLIMLLLVFGLFFLSSVKNNLLLAGAFTLQYFMIPALEFIITCIETFTQYIFISVIYYRHLHSAEELSEKVSDNSDDTFLLSVREKKVKIRTRLFLPAAFILILVFGLSLSWLFSVFVGSDELLRVVTGDIPEITSHRGYSAVAPENTLPSFEAAIESGSQYAELDVQQTSDGVVVLTHDTSLKRCTGVDVNVYDITWEELQKLDAGSYFSAEFTGTRIPSLEEVIKLCKGKIKLNIEIKNNGHSPELEAETVRIILDNDFADECIITSISYDSLVKVKEIAPELKTGYILAMGIGNYYDLPAADFFSVETTFVTEGMVNAIHNRGKEVHVWTVDTEKDAKKMIDLNVDNIITGKPQMVQEKIDENLSLTLQLLTIDGDFEKLSTNFSEDIFERFQSILDHNEENQ